MSTFLFSHVIILSHVMCIYMYLYHKQYIYLLIFRSWLDCFITALVSLIICLLLFASSLTLSVGFSAWCNLITSGNIKK